MGYMRGRAGGMWAGKELSREVLVLSSPLANHVTWASEGATLSLRYLFPLWED